MWVATPPTNDDKLYSPMLVGTKVMLADICIKLIFMQEMVYAKLRSVP